MQFDHVRGPKLFMLGGIDRLGKSLVDIVTEIEKCEVVCANCHSTRTWLRRRVDSVKVAGDDALTVAKRTGEDGLLTVAGGNGHGR